MDSESEHEIEENQRDSDNESINDTEKVFKIKHPYYLFTHKRFVQERIRSELATMSFEDLQKLKQTLGTKIYNETVFGKSNTKKQVTFKRANKNRPREMSSKRPIKIINEISIVKKIMPRDPRFDPLCGSFDERSFKSNYSFINDLKKNEKKELQEELEKTENPERRRKIKLLIQRLVIKLMSVTFVAELGCFSF